jgi:hypothetical protein
MLFDMLPSYSFLLIADTFVNKFCSNFNVHLPQLFFLSTSCAAMYKSLISVVYALSIAACLMQHFI